MRIFQAALPPLHADRLLMAPAPVTLRMASLAPDEALLLSRQPPQVFLRGLLRSRADTRTLRTFIRLTSALLLEALPAVLLRRKASQLSRLLASPFLLQGLQGRLRCRLDSCRLRASSLRQALVVDETGQIIVPNTSFNN